MKRLSILGVIAVAGAVLAAQGAMKIIWTPKQGEKLTYKLATTSKDETGTEVKFSADVTSHVLKVEVDKISIESSMSNFKLLVNGQDLSEFAGDAAEETGVMVFSPDGEIVSFGTSENDPSAVRMAQLMVFLYPKAAMEVGKTWTREFKGSETCPPSRTDFKYLGTEDAHGTRCHKVSISFKELRGDAPTSMEATAWLRPSDGNLVKLSAKLKNVVWEDGMPPSHGDLTLDLKP